MHRVYIYELTDATKMRELASVSQELNISCDNYFNGISESVCVRVPCNRLKLFLIKFSDCVNLIDKTWEME